MHRPNILASSATTRYKWRSRHTRNEQQLEPMTDSKKYRHRFHAKSGVAGYALLCFTVFGVAKNADNEEEIEEVFEEEPKKQPIYRILLTGGPCAGKSTSLSTLQAFLMNHGFVVFTVPEAATMLIMQGGFKPSLATLPIFQKAITSTQHSLETAFFNYAKEIQPSYNGKPIVILIDRGIMEGAAYITEPGKFEQILKHALQTDDNIDPAALLHSKYDMVLHLVTAANGAEKFYENEEFRAESREEAVALDNRLQDVYKAHSDRRIVHNTTSFDEKLSTLMSYVADKLNITALTRKTWRFTVTLQDNMSDIDQIIEELKKTASQQHPLTVTYVTKHYLNHKSKTKGFSGNDEYTFIRETNVLDVDSGYSVRRQVRNIRERSSDMMAMYNRMQGFGRIDDTEWPEWDDSTHYMLVRRRKESGQFITDSETLTKTRYDELRRYSRDRQKQPVEQVSIYFHYKDQFYALEVCIKPDIYKNTMWLKVFRTPGNKYMGKNDVDIDVPPCINIQKNVTHDEEYSTFFLARNLQLPSDR